MKLIHVFLCAFAVVLLSCEKEVRPEIEQNKFRTVLVYLAADNSLAAEAYKNMQQMRNALGDIDGNLLVYAKLPNQTAAIYHISNVEYSKEGQLKIKEYTNHNSSDPNTLKQVFDDVRDAYPASSYGLILWSHATGWIPPGMPGIKLKSFGDDQGREMDIKDLAGALPNDLDFILFDACSMASLEVLYEIKNKAKYIIASPGEVISNGMPYDQTINLFFEKGVQAYESIAQKYFLHYNAMDGLYKSATISVIDASKLHAIAQKTKSILNNQQAKFSDFNRGHVQRMDFDRISNPLIAFDFADFMRQNYMDESVLDLNHSIDAAIIYKGNTAYFNGYQIRTYSGLTCYIPVLDNEEVVHDYYRTLSWYKDSGFDQLF